MNRTALIQEVTKAIKAHPGDASSVLESLETVGIRFVWANPDTLAWFRPFGWYRIAAGGMTTRLGPKPRGTGWKPMYEKVTESSQKGKKAS